MADFPVKSPTRRGMAAGLALFAWAGGAHSAPRERIVTLLGDSITAGYGLAYRDSLPAQLQGELKRLGVAARVRGAGVSGDTTAGGLARLDYSVRPDTSLCVVALGGNDLLRGLSPAAMRRNLAAIVRRLKRRKIPVVLAGIEAPAVVNRTYARQFNAVFREVARAEGVPLYPNLVAGVAGVEALNQPDRIHPNPRGVRVIAARLAPFVARALRARR
jgi:acyl-CoA thioesterase I